MATVLFLGASVSQVPAMRYAREAGHRVVACDGDRNAVGFQLAHASAPFDFTDVARVAEFAAQEGVEGVLAICTDRAVVPAAAISAALGLPGIGNDVARAMTDKATMRARLSEAGVRQPAFRVVGAETDIAAATTAMRLPAVLKPADSGGQRGLFMVRTPDDAVAHLHETLSLSRSRTAMLEEFVDGVELNVLLVMRDGTPTLLIASDRLRPAGAGFGVGWIHSFPSSLAADALDGVRDAAFAAARALGLRDGIAFPQVIAARDGVAVVEVAARIAAGQMADLVRHATGINVFEIAIAQAVGDDVPDAMVSPRFTRPVAIRFFTAEPGVLPVGTVTKVDGLADVRSSPGVLDAGLYFGVGARLRPLQVDADRSGYVVATAETAAEALALADGAAARLVVRTRADVVSKRPRPTSMLALAATGLLVVAAALGLVLAKHHRGPAPLVAGARIDRLLTPLCNCPSDVAHLSFRLLRRGRVTVQMISSTGASVATLVRDRTLGPGPVHLLWRARLSPRHALPDGRYRPQVTFVTPSRVLRLSSVVTLDDGRS